jgi:hypothetical protein
MSLPFIMLQQIVISVKDFIANLAFELVHLVHYSKYVRWQLLMMEKIEMAFDGIKMLKFCITIVAFKMYQRRDYFILKFVPFYVVFVMLVFFNHFVLVVFFNNVFNRHSSFDFLALVKSYLYAIVNLLKMSLNRIKFLLFTDLTL